MRTLIATLLLPISFFGTATLAAVHEVDASGIGDFVNIQEAFDASADGDTILIREGMYNGDMNRQIEWGSRNLTLLGDSSGDRPIVDCESSGRFLTLRDAVTDSTSRIAWLHVINGEGSAGTQYGGTIACDYASPVIEDCVFSDCTGQYGGGVLVVSSEAKLVRCQFWNCSGEYSGAVSAAGGTPLVQDCLFVGNTASVQGGGIRLVSDGVPVVRGCTLVGNASPDGGGIALDYGSNAVIEHCIVAFSTEGAGISGDTATDLMECIVFENAGGDSLGGSHHDNLFVDPLFCDAGGADYRVCADSPALALYNDWQAQIGCFGSGCPECNTSIGPSSWGLIKSLYRGSSRGPTCRRSN
jgi:hypothetical protein